MRIAITNQFRHVAGGAETYLRNLLPELSRRGIEIGLWHDVDLQPNRDIIELPAGAPAHCLQTVGLAAARTSLADWKPDLIYSNSSSQKEWESVWYATAPVVQFIHTYDGTCISGNKAWKSPIARPCKRTLGWQCLAHYYPHRCGGLNPLTMIRNYSAQSRRLESLKRSAAILTASEHMRDEYLKHGFSPGQVRVAGLYLPHLPPPPSGSLIPLVSDEIRILFCGRMVWLKGGQLLLDALPAVTEHTAHRLRISFLGDGTARREWQSRAEALQRRYPRLQIQFLEWRSQEECESIYRQHHLLAIPSVWPEPFGLSGPEAAQHGLPAVAFAVGGIVDWLIDGVNGHLAPGDPPTAAGLSAAILKCISDPLHHQRLRDASLQLAGKFTLDRHLEALLPVFESAADKQATPIY